MAVVFPRQFFFLLSITLGTIWSYSEYCLLLQVRWNINAESILFLAPLIRYHDLWTWLLSICWETNRPVIYTNSTSWWKRSIRTINHTHNPPPVRLLEISNNHEDATHDHPSWACLCPYLFQLSVKMGGTLQVSIHTNALDSKPHYHKHSFVCAEMVQRRLAQAHNYNWWLTIRYLISSLCFFSLTLRFWPWQIEDVMEARIEGRFCKCGEN